jgi:predicted RNA-binding Zn ribbon-like protein
MRAPSLTPPDLSPPIPAAEPRPSRVLATPSPLPPQASLLDPGEAALADTRALRDLIDPVLAGDRLTDLTHRWAQAIARSELIAGREAGPAQLRVGADPLWMIPDRLADALVDLVRTADRSRLRTCPLADGGCGWLFLDRSRNGTRRWCSMDDCGAHAKARRLTERRRAHRTG